MRNWLRLEEGVILSPWKTRQIKSRLEIENYKTFEELRIVAEAEKVRKAAEKERGWG